ncbi:MAG: hypothetical protein GX927_06950 [Lentisphaerae bacterium]|nr:hypothetical protein [Lentisphaerota bacterium]
MKFSSFAIILMLLCPAIAFSVVKLDIDGREMGIPVSEGNASEGLAPRHP